jgi:hypothetical protein
MLFWVTPMNNHCTCGVEDCNRLLRYRIETLKEIFSVMRAGEEAREAMKLKWEKLATIPLSSRPLQLTIPEAHLFPYNVAL